MKKQDAPPFRIGQIHQTVRKGAFGRGVRPWLLLVAVCFLFSFLGSVNGTSTAFLGTIDGLLGPKQPGENAVLLMETLYGSGAPEPTGVMARLLYGLIDTVTRDHTWLVNLLATNGVYFHRNAKEVAAYLLLAALLWLLLRLFLQNVLAVGYRRYAQEHRQADGVLFGRALLPFRHGAFGNVMRVQLAYFALLYGSLLTVVGLPYVFYTYRMVPSLLAEDPFLSRKQAFALSRRMTSGNRWRMFLSDLSFVHLWLLRWIPVLGVLIALPGLAMYETELYFRLRNTCAEASPMHRDPAYDLPPVWERAPSDAKPSFRLPDPIEREKPERKQRLRYRFTDLVLLFFTCGAIGWIWEVGYNFLKFHNLANRGTLYGPWLPIYGVVGLLVILLGEFFRLRPVKMFFLVMAVSGVVEFFTSWALEFFFNTFYWQYRGMFANLNGRVCLVALLAFGVGGTFMVYITGPWLRKQYARLPEMMRKGICAILLTAFAADLLCVLLFGFNSGKGISWS